MANIKKFVREKRAQYLELVGQGNTLTYAADLIGVSYETIRLYRTAHPSYDKKVLAARMTQVDMVADALYTSALGGNVTAQIFLLVNRTRHLPRNDPEKWMHLNSIVVSGPEGKPVEVEIKSKDDLRRFVTDLEQEIDELKSEM